MKSERARLSRIGRIVRDRGPSVAVPSGSQLGVCIEDMASTDSDGNVLRLGAAGAHGRGGGGADEKVSHGGRRRGSGRGDEPGFSVLPVVPEDGSASIPERDLYISSGTGGSHASTRSAMGSSDTPMGQSVTHSDNTTVTTETSSVASAVSFDVSEDSMLSGDVGDDLTPAAVVKRRRHAARSWFAAQVPVADERRHVPPISPIGRTWWRTSFWFRKMFAFTGPSWMLVIMYIDPGNVAASLQSGNAVESSGWQLAVATLVVLLLQLFAMRVAIVAGGSLARLSRDQFSRRLRVAMFVGAALVMAGAGAQNILGSTVAMQILAGDANPLSWAYCLIAAAVVGVLGVVEKGGIRAVESLIALGALAVGALSIALIAVLHSCTPAVESPTKILQLSFDRFVPPKTSYQNVVLMYVVSIGASVLPQSAYFQSTLMQSRKIERRSEAKMNEALRYSGLDIFLSVTFSFGVNLCLIVISRMIFKARLCGNLKFDDVSLAQVGLTCLGSKSAPPGAQRLFAAILLISGLLSGYFVVFSAGVIGLEFFRWRWLRPKFHTPFVRGMFLVVSLAFALGVVFARATRDGSTNTLLSLGSAYSFIDVTEAVALPLTIIPLVKIATARQLMGPYAENKRWLAIGVVLTLLLVVSSYYVGLDKAIQLHKIRTHLTKPDVVRLITAGVVTLMYLWLLFALLFTPMQPPLRRRPLLGWTAGRSTATWWEREESVAAGLRQPS